MNNKKNLLIIEPYYTGSHKKWADGLKKYLINYNVDIVKLEGRNWKWRMHGSAITLNDVLKNIKIKYDLILATDMLDVSLFRSLNKNLSSVPLVLYFHENQMSYPLKNNKSKVGKDLHFGFINYTSALVAEKILFNSKYHYNNFFDEIDSLLRRMPDYNNIDTIEKIKAKSDVLYLGIEYHEKIEFAKKNDVPVILWNHRWEHDKKPDDFYLLIKYLQKENIDFKLVLLGESFKNKPAILEKIERDFENQIIHSGYCSDHQEYCHFIQMSDLLPVTNIQDFFGISIAEAVYFGVLPLLPKRLSYPELYLEDQTDKYFYESEKELFENCRAMLENIDDYKTEIFVEKAKKFAWENIIDKYEKEFNNIIA